VAWRRNMSLSAWDVPPGGAYQFSTVAGGWTLLPLPFFTSSHYAWLTPPHFSRGTLPIASRPYRLRSRDLSLGSRRTEQGVSIGGAWRWRIVQTCVYQARRGFKRHQQRTFTGFAWFAVWRTDNSGKSASAFARQNQRHACRGAAFLPALCRL